MKDLYYYFLLLVSFFIFSLNVQSQNSIDSCIVIQPGFEKGMDAEIFSCDVCGYDTINYGSIQDVCATAWTHNGDTSLIRSLLYFDYYIPLNFDIVSAKLSLYHNPNSPEGQHSSLTNSNASIVQRITSSWYEEYVTWVTQPQTTTLNQVLIPQTLSATQDFIDIDITQLVIDARNNPNSSFGFMLKLQAETYYSKLVFASSDYPVDSLHPKLEICLDRNSVGIKDVVNEELSVKFFPNPATDKVTIQLNKQEDIQLELLNVLGETVFQENYTNTNLINISTADFSSGVYFLRISDNQAYKSIKKLIIR